MKGKLAIYCDCDSDSGMSTYTLMLLSALKEYSDIYTLLVSSKPRNDAERVRLDRLKSYSSEVKILTRDGSARKIAAQFAGILTESKVDFYIPNYRYMPHMVMSFIPRNIKNIIIVHSDTNEIYQSIKFYSRVIDGVIFPSQSAFKKSEKIIPECVNRVHIPHYFSSLGKAINVLDNNCLRIVYHGRLAHGDKKSMELLKIAQELHKLKVPFHLKIIGSGNAMADIRQTIADESVSNVELVGQVSRDQLLHHLQGADIALSTSIYEGFGYSVAESLSLGIIPVVYENEVLHDLIQDGINGFMVPWGQADMVAKKIQSLFLDRKKMLQMHRAAIESVQPLISAERYVVQMIEFLTKLSNTHDGKSWPILRPRGLAYDTLYSRLVAKIGRKLRFW